MTAVTVIRVLLGALYLTAPQALPGLVFGVRLDHRARTVVRILGGRHMIQAALTEALPRRWMVPIGSGVDAIHAGSFALLGLFDRRRRLACADAAAAGAFSAAGLCAAIRTRTAAPRVSTVSRSLQ